MGCCVGLLVGVVALLTATAQPRVRFSLVLLYPYIIVVGYCLHYLMTALLISFNFNILLLLLYLANNINEVSDTDTQHIKYNSSHSDSDFSSIFI